jgi:hypothetical protein
MSDEPKKNELDSLDLAVSSNTAKVNEAIQKIERLLEKEKTSGKSSNEQIEKLESTKSALQSELAKYKQRLEAATNTLNQSTQLLDEKIKTIKEDGRRRRSRKSRSKKKRSRRTKRKYRK